METRTRWLLGVGLAGLVLFGPGTYELIRLSIRQHRLDRQLAALKAEHERLAKEQERLQSDPAYLEGLIRSTFKVSQPGELVIPLDKSSTNGDLSTFSAEKTGGKNRNIPLQ